MSALIGEIRLIPKNADIPDGYIKFNYGVKFNKHMYPDLYNVLGTDTFASSTAPSDFPIGTCVLSLSYNIPEGWTALRPVQGILSRYPELKAHLEHIVSNQRPSAQKDIWLAALANNSLPKFSDNGFFIKNGPFLGEYREDTTKIVDLMALPAMYDDAETVRPEGVYLNKPEEVTSAFFGDVKPTDTNVDYVIQLAKAPNNTKAVKIEQAANDDETAPKSMQFHIWIKTTHAKPIEVVSSHKQIIKAYEV